jgi:DNA-binding winged helix-turn-helix (wHTH) protein
LGKEGEVSTRTNRTTRIIRFASYELDLRAGELRKDGERVRIQEQPFRVLAMLAERPGEVVLREDIRRRLWPNDTAVEVGHGINAAVQRLREALGETAEAPRFIETVARRGYRFRSETAAASDTTPAGNTRYRIVEKLGGGGMGVVYRAEDLKLGRAVALKLLSPEMAGDPVAVGRFEREARAASALNHPNICTIYGIEELNGQPAIAMELIEGPTLESMLARGPLPVDRAVAIASQIAEALDAAHTKGIVHRDLKPANVLLSGSQVKVLDFGVAKMAGADFTLEGPVVGTPRYMSPEQSQGRAVDARTDLYNFGLVLYEMLTGKQAYGATSTRVEPAALDRVLQRCLAPHPEDRWQSAKDLKAALELAAAVPAARRWRWRPRREHWVGAAAGVAVAVVVLSVGRSPAEGRKVEPEVWRMTVRGPGDVAASGVSLSPDGRRLAYQANRRLYVRTLEEGDARPVPGSEGAGVPFWSPDGKGLAFTTGGALLVSDLTGAPRAIAAVNTNIAGTWGADGSILIGRIGDGIYRVAASGGPLERLTVPDAARGESRHLLPQFFGRAGEFLYVAGNGVLYAGRSGSAERREVMPVTSGVQWVKGYLLFTRNHVLMAQAFDADRAQGKGPEFVIAGDVASKMAMGAKVEVPDFSATVDAVAYRASEGVVVERGWMGRVR